MLHGCVTAHWIAEIGPYSKMVEWEGDQAFPSLLDLSLSLTKSWVTEDPITLQDSPPSFSDRAAFTDITEVEGGDKKTLQ